MLLPLARVGDDLDPGLSAGRMYATVARLDALADVAVDLGIDIQGGVSHVQTSKISSRARRCRRAAWPTSPSSLLMSSPRSTPSRRVSSRRCQPVRRAHSARVPRSSGGWSRSVSLTSSSSSTVPPLRQRRSRRFWAWMVARKWSRLSSATSGATGARFIRATVATRTRPGRTGARARGQRSPQDKTNKHEAATAHRARPSTSRARDGRLHPQRPGRHGRVRGRRLTPHPHSFPV